MKEADHPLKEKLPLPLMASISALPALSIDMYLPAIPGMAESLNAQISTIQNSLSIFLLAFGFGMLFFGPLADKYGRRPLALFGLAGFGLASLGLSLSSTAGEFLFFRFFQGVLGSAATVVIPAIIRDCFGKDTAKGMSTVTMIMLTAPLVAPLIGSVLLIISDWRAIFLFLTGYSLIAFLLTLWKLPETLSTESKTQQRSFLKNYLHIFTTPRIYPYLATFLMSSLAFFTYLTSAPFVYITWFGMSEIQFALIFTTTAVSLIVANFINVRHVSRQGPRNMMYFGLASGCLFSLMLLLVTLANLNMFLTVACFFMIIGSLGIISVNAESLILIEFPNQASTASAVTRTLRFSTGALVGPILALVYTGTPVPIAILVVIGLGLAALMQLVTFMQAKKSRG
ncbi:MAG: multidrug effflux MFS transporter [Gammaproteobacteria bacterium]|nr:multidrug effflux MFS transporter [Gammaproteobacteria bacterium]